MILIKNKQRSIKIDTILIKEQVTSLLNVLSYADFDISIMFLSPPCMQYYNATFRSINKPTDILSFAAHPMLKAGERIIPLNQDDKNLGDILLCPRYIHDTLAQWNMDFEERLRVLLVHGICHLLGYDHEDDNDYKIMHQQEKYLLSVLANN